MKLLPLDAPGAFELAADWLGRKENYQWLELGSTSQRVTSAALRIMVQRNTHFLRVYTSDADDTPIGICGLSSINRGVGSATFWGASGDKSFRCRGFGTRAGSKFLTLAFRELGLRSINTWIVERNSSLRLIERLGFRFVGRQRHCHQIDGRTYDRLLFDLLVSEHHELDEAGWRRQPARQEERQPATIAV